MLLVSGLMLLVVAGGGWEWWSHSHTTVLGVLDGCGDVVSFFGAGVRSGFANIRQCRFTTHKSHQITVMADAVAVASSSENSEAAATAAVDEEASDNQEEKDEEDDDEEERVLTLEDIQRTCRPGSRNSSHNCHCCLLTTESVTHLQRRLA